MSQHAYIAALTGTLPTYGDIFLQNPSQPFTALPPSLCPLLKKQDVTTYTNPDCLNMISFPHLLKPMGYTCFSHSGDHYSVTENYLKNLKFNIIKPFQRSTFNTYWGITDEDLFTNVLENIDANNPQFHSIITTSSHFPFTAPPPWNTLYEDCENPHNRIYMQALNYVDHALDQFIHKLKSSPVGDNSLIFLFGDHGFHQDMDVKFPHCSNNLADGVSQTLTHVPLLILSPGKIPQPRSFPFACSQIDLLPTVMDLLSVHEPNHAVGSSLCRTSQNKSATLIQETKQFAVGYVNNHVKWIFDQKGNKYQYDLKKDPNETNNIYKTTPSNLALEKDLFEGILFNRHCFHNNTLVSSSSSKKHLDIDKVKNFWTEFTSAPNLFFTNAHLKTLPNNKSLLQAVSLRHTFVSDEGIQALCNFYTNIKRIELSYSSLITSVAVNALLTTFSLQYLELNGLTDKGILEQLSNLTPSLDYLAINALATHDHHLLTIATKAPHLQYLTINGAHLTPQGILHLSSHLKTLTIHNLSHLTQPYIDAINQLPLQAILFHDLQQLETNALKTLTIPHIGFSNPPTTHLPIHSQSCLYIEGQHTPHQQLSSVRE